MNNPSSLVEEGAACARCGVEFDGAHGRPVLCHTCHDKYNLVPSPYALPKAWLEEKAK